MTQALYTHAEIVVFLGTLVLMLLAIFLGYVFGRIRHTEADQGSSLLQSAMLTLLSLLLAFGVSIADLRYEARKQLEIEESNAIGTTYLRADLLRPGSAELKAMLRDYVKLRIRFYGLPAEPEAGASLERETSDLQKRMWKLAGGEMIKKPTIEKSLLLTSMNESFDLSEKQTFTFLNRVPKSIIGMLYLGSLIIGCLVGFLLAKGPVRQVAAILALALMVSMTLFVILDLDRPRKGLIRIEPESLLRLESSIGQGY